MSAAKKYDYASYLQKMLRRLQRNVRHLRKAMNLTVEEAAERSGIHRRHWQKIEAGENNATMETIVRIAKGLVVDLGELLGPELPPVPEVPASKRSGRKKKSARPHARHSRARK